MKIRTSKRIKRVLSGMLSLVMTSSLASALPAVAAEEADCYPYALFASSENDGAITVNAQSFNVNGNIATNGSLFKSGNMNLNGMQSENIGESMPFFVDKIEEVYFSGEYEFYTEDYILVETNVNHSKPIKVQGNYTLDGNINSSSALMAQNNIHIEGNTINANNSVLCAQYGNISIDCSNVNFSGLIYAPMGTVEITAENISLNSVVVIADEIVLEANNVNVGYSSWAGQLVGTEFTETPDEEIDYEKDTDEDGIPDFIEEEFGTDINSSDTDNDGLSDLFELVNGTTDPTTSDSDSNGISDADEDYDKDGLTSLEEQEAETDPTDKDSDSDGVTDGDEVNIHNTNPIVKDTDEDGLYDGEEIYFESDPNNKDTNGDGISDGDEKREQTFEYDYSDEDCAVIGVNITMNATGNIYRTTSVKSVMDKDILCSDVVGLVGEPFEIETTSQFDNATITFEVDKTKLGETQFDELIFLWYDEENYRFVEMETTYDEQSSTVSTQTTHFSKYMIVDRTEWFTAWNNAYTKYGTFANRTIHTVICYDCSGSMETYDPYFIQYQYGNHGELIEQDYTNGRILAINSYINAMRTNLINKDRLALVRFADSARLVHSMSGDKDSLRSSIEISNKGATHANLAIPYALSQFELYSRSASVKNVIMLTDGQFTITEYNLNRLLERDIQLYIVGLGNSMSSEKIAQYTAYENVEYYAAATGEQLEEIYENLAGRHQFNLSALADSDNDGMPDEFEVSGMVCQDGNIYYSNPQSPDSDGDGLLDGQEITYKADKAVHYNYGLKQDETTYYSVSFKMYSDPMEADTDGDGVEDGFDVQCTNKKNNGEIIEALSLDRIYNAYMLHIEDDVSPLYDLYISMGVDSKMSWAEYVEFYNKKYDCNFSISYAQETELMISTIQRCLEYLGYLDMGGAGYGTMGGATKAAIQNFQINYGLVPAKEICIDSYYFIEVDHITYLTIINVATNYGYGINGIDSKKDNYEILSNLTAYGYSKVYFTRIPSTRPRLTETQLANGTSIYVGNGKFDLIYYFDYTKPLDTIINSLCRESLKYSNAPRTVRYGYFISKVNHNEEWDVKRREQWIKTIPGINYYSQRFKFCYNSYIMNSEDLGNYIFGYTGHCLGFTQAELNLGSIFAGSTGNSPDDEKDKYYIQLGYRYYHRITN